MGLEPTGGGAAVFPKENAEADAADQDNIISRSIMAVDKKKGNNVIVVDKNAFREAVLKNTKPTDHGYRQQDYDRIIAIQ